MNEPSATESSNERPGDRRRNLALAGLHAVTAILGVLLVLTPLALWIAWSPGVLFTVLGAGIAAAVALLACRWLAQRYRAQTTATSAAPPVGPPPVSDQFLAELSGMGPFTYHNRLTGDYKFRLKMARLRRLLGPR